MRELVVPIVPFPTDVGTNAKNGVHPGMLDLLEEPDDVVVPLEVVLRKIEKIVQDSIQHEGILSLGPG